jgi:hypothetical protein
MVQAAHLEDTDDVAGAPALREVPGPDHAAGDEGQVVAEVRFARTVLIGVLIGMAVCAVLWIGLVLLALAGSGERLGPMLWVGAGIGMFAGVFFGGSAGSMIGARALERHEQHELGSAARDDLST